MRNPRVSFVCFLFLSRLCWLSQRLFRLWCLFAFALFMFCLCLCSISIFRHSGSFPQFLPAPLWLTWRAWPWLFTCLSVCLSPPLLSAGGRIISWWLFWWCFINSSRRFWRWSNFRFPPQRSRYRACVVRCLFFGPSCQSLFWFALFLRDSVQMRHSHRSLMPLPGTRPSARMLLWAANCLHRRFRWISGLNRRSVTFAGWSLDLSQRCRCLVDDGWLTLLTAWEHIGQFVCMQLITCLIMLQPLSILYLHCKAGTHGQVSVTPSRLLLWPPVRYKHSQVDEK